MSNPGSRSNDDKLLAKIKDLEAEVEDLKRHTHPDRARGKPTPAAGSLGLFACDDQLTVPDSTSHTAVTLTDLGVGVGVIAQVSSGKLEFLVDGTFEVSGVCQIGEGGSASSEIEFVIDTESGSPTVYGPVEARAEMINGNGATLNLSIIVQASAGDQMYASVQSDTNPSSSVSAHVIVIVKGPF